MSLKRTKRWRMLKSALTKPWVCRTKIIDCGLSRALFSFVAADGAWNERWKQSSSHWTVQCAYVTESLLTISCVWTTSLSLTDRYLSCLVAAIWMKKSSIPCFLHQTDYLRDVWCEQHDVWDHKSKRLVQRIICLHTGFRGYYAGLKEPIR